MAQQLALDIPVEETGTQSDNSIDLAVSLYSPLPGVIRLLRSAPCSRTPIFSGISSSSRAV